MAEHNDFGKWGEEIATRHLIDKGYYIVERDWRHGHKDIDIIALDDDCYVFVEVKTRRRRDFGDPIEAIDRTKREHLRAAISSYLKTHSSVMTCRFDVISIVAPKKESPDIQHVEDVPLL